MSSKSLRDSPRYWTHQVAIGAVVLVLAILASSAYLRQSAILAACADPPVCSSQTIAGNALREQPAGASAARMLHRLSASAAGAAVVLIAYLCWMQTPRVRAEVAISSALLAIVVFLAALGRFSTTPSPAVTLGNLVGGMALLGLLHWMWLRTSPAAGAAGAPYRKTAPWAAIALAFAALEFLLGSLLSAGKTGVELQLDPAQALKLAHSLGGVALLALVGALALRSPLLQGRGRMSRPLAFVLAVLLAGTGWIAGQSAPPVASTVLHNLLAAALLMALATVTHAMHDQKIKSAGG